MSMTPLQKVKLRATRDVLGKKGNISEMLIFVANFWYTNFLFKLVEIYDFGRHDFIRYQRFSNFLKDLR